jgi:hypothetical protein
MSAIEVEQVILDRVDGLEILDADVLGFGNEISSLAYLWEGMEFLYAQVLRMEEDACRRLDCDRYKTVVYLNVPALRGIPQGLIAAAFHWYSVSACNYVRLVGWMANAKSPAAAQDYLSAMLPKMKLWRDKVGAHFAQTKPLQGDTAATLASSVMFPVGFSDRRFVTQPVTVVMKIGGVSSTTPDMQWSLTEVHELLRTRYSPLTPAGP